MENLELIFESESQISPIRLRDCERNATNFVCDSHNLISFTFDAQISSNLMLELSELNSLVSSYSFYWVATSSHLLSCPIDFRDQPIVSTDCIILGTAESNSV